MKNLIFGALILVSLFLLTDQDAFAINYDPGTTYYINSITPYADGATMAGMQFTIVTQFQHRVEGTSDLLTETYTNTATWEKYWDPLAINKGDVPLYNPYCGTYMMYQDGDTLTNPFSLIPSPLQLGKWLKSITWDAAPGGVVFNVSQQPFQICDMSEDGYSWDVASVTYSDQVALLGQDPSGDLYRKLTIEFDPGFRGYGGGLIFLADTDTFSPIPTPLPSTLLLLGYGLLGLAGWRRLRKG